MLNKSKALHPNENGKLIPQEVALQGTVEGEKETIKMIPIPRTKLKEIFNKAEGDKTDKDTDGEIILNYCIEPSFTKEELEFIKPTVLTNIAATIINVSFGKREDIEKI